jgi:hypothetical protein
MSLAGFVVLLAWFAAAPALHWAAEAPRDRQCPVQDPAFVRESGDRCFGEVGANYAFAFAYPAAAARIPALDALLRRAKDVAAREFRTLAEHARAHPGQWFHEEAIYRVDADLAELLALSFETSNYQGGAHGDYGGGTLIWDKAANRPIEFGALFRDRPAAFAEVARLFCPPFNQVRRRSFERGGGRVVDRCPDPPYYPALVANPGGRIATLRLLFVQHDGYAGGSYTVEIPVTPGLIVLLRPRFRAAFAVSDAAPRACNPNVRDERCR